MPRILISPLNWGLGHATRCVPVIREQIAKGNEVILASNGSARIFLERAFPGLTHWNDIPGYDITYPVRGSFMLHMFTQLPGFLGTIREEQKWLKKKIREQGVDEVISDNRYGLYSDKISTSLITHQVFPRVPAPLNFISDFFLRRFISRFTSCLIPDYADPQINLTGELSHGNIPANARYIGPLSRFPHGSFIDTHPKYEFLALISGPEPQRTIFQNKMCDLLETTGLPSVVLCGKPQEEFSENTGNIEMISHLPDDEILKVIRGSRNIICRAGYSTIMDLETLGRKALLVPTPGQTEQEYLAAYLSDGKGYRYLTQKEINSATLLNSFPLP